MSEVLNEYEREEPKRPVFLTVLCILTFIGSSFGLIGGIYGFLTAKVTATAMQSIGSMNNFGDDDNPGSKVAKTVMTGLQDVYTVKNLQTNAAAGIAAGILCLLGAFWMWGLKKKGFYSYVAGTAIGAGVPIVVFGLGNIFLLGATIFGALFGVVFCVMYALNLKHME